MGMPDFGKKHKGGKKELPTKLKTPTEVKKALKRKSTLAANYEGTASEFSIRANEDLLLKNLAHCKPNY